MTFTYKLLGNHTGPGKERTPINAIKELSAKVDKLENGS